MKYLILMSLLLLTGCGQAVKTASQTFKLNGRELMETTYCIWVEPTLSGTIVVNVYSDGSNDKSAALSFAGLIGYITMPTNDFPDIYYTYYDHVGMIRQGSLVGDDTVCQHRFYNYE